MTRGRALGPGRLKKEDRSWVFTWSDENRKRRRKVLSTNRQAAEHIRVEILQRRDLALAGLGSEAGQSSTLREICDLYLEDLRERVTPAHFKNVNQRLTAIVDQLGGVRVRDLRVMDLVRIRSQATPRKICCWIFGNSRKP